MAANRKAAYYRALKEAGVELTAHYREYTEEDFRVKYEEVAARDGLPLVPPEIEDIEEARESATLPNMLPDSEDDLDDVEALKRQLAAMQAQMAQMAQVVASGANVTQEHVVETRHTDPTELAGGTANTHMDGDILEIDEHGRIWYQKEVRKSAYPKPRGRRVLRQDSGQVRTETITVEGYTETFEVEDERSASTPTEIKVTLPSFQTGIFRETADAPFRIHIYNGVRGFDFDDVNRYYGGVDLVPSAVRRMYVSNDLCYDILSVIRAIEDERREQLFNPTNEFRGARR